MNNLPYYRELQGVMTRFEALTDTALQKLSEEGLTVSEIKTELESRGLDLQYVVHDPSRAIFSTYYADYERGVYGDIFFQRNMIDGMLPLYEIEKGLKGGIRPELLSREWASYYEICVPLPLSLIHI